MAARKSRSISSAKGGARKPARASSHPGFRPGALGGAMAIALVLVTLGVRAQVTSVPDHGPQTTSPAASPTATPTATSTSTQTALPAASPGSPTSTGTPTDSPTATVSPTSTPTRGTPTDTPTVTMTPTKTPALARSAIALLPTAYSNRLNRTDGLNLDLLFSYYIGSIAEKDSGAAVEWLNPLRTWMITADIKYGWLGENGNQPAIASGFIDTLLLQGGNPGATGSSTGTLKFTTQSLGSVYTAVSKTVGKNAHVHLGYMRGDLAGTAHKKGFLSHVLPNGNHADLLPLFAQGLASIQNESAPNILYVGWDFKFLGTAWRFEVLKPFPLSKHPVLINTKIDKLLSFNLAYERWQGGYALLGYFNFRFTIIPSEPKKKTMGL